MPLRKAKRAFWFLAPAFCLWGITFPAGAAADIDYFNLPPEQLLNATVVSASKREETISNAPAAIYVITQEDIQRAGVQTLPEALRMAPGVQVAQADSNTWAITIRGFNGTLTNKLLVLIDGRTVYNPLFAGTYWELQNLMLEDIDRIEVVRGPGGTLWGANAVNGVINIITKSAHETQGTIATAAFGTTGSDVAARRGGDFKDGYYRIYAHGFARADFSRPGGGSANDDWNGGQSGFRADWNDRFTLQGDVYRVLSDQINATPTSVAPFSVTEKETINSHGANLLARWNNDTSNGGKWMVQSYLDYKSRDQVLLNDRRTTFDLETQYNLPPFIYDEITLGGGYRYIMDDLKGEPYINFSPDSRQDNVISFFAQDKITLSPGKLFLTLGSKFEHNDYTGFELQPNARLQWHIDSSQSAWAAVSRAVRTPSRLESDLTYRTGSIGGTAVILVANPDLRSEELIAYEVGYRKQISPDFSIDTTAFYNDYDKMITVGFLPTSPGIFPITSVNGMKAETYGFEISSLWRAAANIKVNANYSYIDLFAHVTNNGGFNLETAEDLVPHHQANVRVSWNMTDNVALDTSAYYVSKLHQMNVDDYFRLDMNLGWQVKNGMRLNLIGQNLLQDSHREFNAATNINAAEVDRAFLGKFTWEF